MQIKSLQKEEAPPSAGTKSHGSPGNTNLGIGKKDGIWFDGKESFGATNEDMSGRAK
jgi:hypothetical protein